MKTPIGTVVAIENKERKFGSSLIYNHVWLTRDGKTESFAFTDRELEDARGRSRKNPEDAPKLRRDSLTNIWLLVITITLIYLAFS